MSVPTTTKEYTHTLTTTIPKNIGLMCYRVMRDVTAGNLAKRANIPITHTHIAAFPRCVSLLLVGTAGNPRRVRKQHAALQRSGSLIETPSGELLSEKTSGESLVNGNYTLRGSCSLPCCPATCTQGEGWVECTVAGAQDTRRKAVVMRRKIPRRRVLSALHVKPP